MASARSKVALAKEAQQLAKAVYVDVGVDSDGNATVCAATDKDAASDPTKVMVGLLVMILEVLMNIRESESAP